MGEHHATRGWVLAVTGVCIGLGLVIGVTGQPAVIAEAGLAFYVSFILALPVHIVLHEFGHLALAAMLGLRPKAVLLFGRTFRLSEDGCVSAPGERNAVLVDPRTDSVALPVRMIAFAMAGPAANLATAAAIWTLTAGRPGTILVAVALSAVGFGMANLCPRGLRSKRALSDGDLVRHWLGSDQNTAETCRRGSEA